MAWRLVAFVKVSLYDKVERVRPSKHNIAQFQLVVDLLIL